MGTFIAYEYFLIQVELLAKFVQQILCPSLGNFIEM